MPVNDSFNVMRGSFSNKHRVVVKLTKKLDELMIRDVWHEKEESEGEEDFSIPVPSCYEYGAYSSDINPSNLAKEEAKLDTNKIPSLTDLAVHSISQYLDLSNALDVLIQADMLLSDELKINALKFISLNIVSFFELASFEKLCTMPLYLIKDLENFLKL